MNPRQLILTDATLRVACAVLPPGRAVEELVHALDPANAGHLRVVEVMDVLRRLDTARADRGRLVTDDALLEAIAQYRRAMSRLDYTIQGEISIFVWDPERDGEPYMAPRHTVAGESPACQ